MSYTPTNWQSGDIVTSEKLNKLEQGVVSNGQDLFIINLIGEGPYQSNRVADKTYGEIAEAFFSGKRVVLCWQERNYDPQLGNDYFDPTVVLTTYTSDPPQYKIDSSSVHNLQSGYASQYPTEYPD